MEPFKLLNASSSEAAVAAYFKNPHQSAFLAGGTNLIDLMKLGVEVPGTVVDVNPLPLAKIELLTNGQLRLGAMARNSDVAFHAEVKKRFPLLAEAILSGASPQLRNMATIGGNLLQRTRCGYFNDLASPCNKRKSGTGCPAIQGFNRSLAVLGTSDHCIATNPSDMNVALAAIDPLIQVHGKTGARTIAYRDFHVVPGATPQIETSLQPGELITAVDLPALPFATRSRYLKVRDRASYEFALVSVAVILDLDRGTIRSARLALGGVGTKPWRSGEAERVLIGATASPTVFRAAAEAALKDAQGYGQNNFKIPLAKNAILRALTETQAMELPS